jgi:hypothetical protein
MFWCADGRRRRARRVAGQWSALDGLHLPRSPDGSLALRLRRLPPPLWLGLLSLRARVVVRDLHADLAGVLALAGEAEPLVALAAARRDNGREVRPGLANQLRLLVVVEDRHLQAVVVGRVVDGEAQLLVPADVSRCSPVLERIPTIWVSGRRACPSSSSSPPCLGGRRSKGPASPWCAC